MPEPEDTIAAAVAYARAAERIAAALATLMPSVTAIQSICELDPSLSPELTAALEHIGEAADALQRAFVFADARLTVRLEPQQEGEPT